MFKILLFLLFLQFNIIYSQEHFQINNFRELSGLEGNFLCNQKGFGSDCAILKIKTTLTNVNFEGMYLDSEESQGEYILFVRPGIKYIKIKKENFIDTIYFFENKQILENHVYEFYLNRPALTCRVIFNLNQDDVSIGKDNEALVTYNVKQVNYNLPNGKYLFRFYKEKFCDTIINFTIKNDTLIDVKLLYNPKEKRIKSYLKLESQPEGALVYFNNSTTPSGQTPYAEFVYPGTYHIKLSKPLYYDYETDIILLEGETYEYKNLILPNRFGYISLTTDPSSCQISINNKDPYISPIERLKYESGRYIISIKKDQYYEKFDTIMLRDNVDTLINYRLNPSHGTLNLETTPGNRKIFLDEKYYGLSNINKTFKLPSGEYTLKLDGGEYYLSYSEKIKISDGKTLDKKVMLEENFGLLDVKSNGSRIYLDSNYIGFNNIIDYKLLPGKYIITAKKDKHHDAKEIFVIGRKERILKNLNPRPKIGYLGLDISPEERRANSKIYINDSLINKTAPIGLPLLIGEYDITVWNEECCKMTKSVELIENEEIPFKFELYCLKKDTNTVGKKIKRKALILSFIPTCGLGHFYKNKTFSGTVYFISGTSSLAYAIYNNIEYLKAVNDYNVLTDRLNNEYFSISERIDMINQRNDLINNSNNYYKKMQYTYSAFIAIWSINVIHNLLIMDVDKKMNKILLKKLNCSLLGNKNGYLLSLRYNF